MKFGSSFTTLCLSAFLLFLHSASATPRATTDGAPVITSKSQVYKWKDENGIVHFTSQKPFDSAEPAKLPEIMKGEVKLVEKKLVSCKSHGGIDCQAGADNDGSVICYDGFRGAATRYRLSCNSPKLQITQVTELTQTGTFTVLVRNSKSVEASKPALFYRPGGGKEFRLKGPKTIEAFGLAEFLFEPTDTEPPLRKATIAQLDLTCANCP